MGYPVDGDQLALLLQLVFDPAPVQVYTPPRFLLTDMEYVLFVTPSCAVTTTLIFVGLLLIAMACEAVPDVTACPFTVTVAFGSLVVGFTVNEAVDAVTDAV